MDKVHPETGHKVHAETSHRVLRAGRFVNKEEASKSTNVSRMASLFDGGQEPRSPVLNRSSLREPSPLVTRKNEMAAPISIGSKSAKLPNGSTFQKNKVTITTSARQTSPASPLRSTGINRAAFTKTIQVTSGSGSVCSEKDERYQKVMGVRHPGRAGSNPTSPVKKPSGGGAVIKPMGMMGYGYGSYMSSSYRLETYLNKTSGSPYRSSTLQSPVLTNRAKPANRASVSPVKAPPSRQPPTPARNYADDYSDSSDDDTPDTQSSEEGDETTSPLAVTEKHPGGVYFKTTVSTSPLHRKSTSKTPPSSPAQGSCQTVAVTQKPNADSFTKSPSHPVAAKQPGGLYFTSTTKKRPSSPTRLPWDKKKSSPSISACSSSKSTSDLSEFHLLERNLSKSKSTQELSQSSNNTCHVTNDKEKEEMQTKESKKKAKVIRNSPSSVSLKIEREKASSTLKRSPSGSFKLPYELQAKSATLSSKKIVKERAKSLSDMSSMEPQLYEPKCSPSKAAVTKATDVPQSEHLLQHEVTQESVEKHYKKVTSISHTTVITDTGVAASDTVPLLKHSPQRTTAKFAVSSTTASPPKLSHSPSQGHKSLPSLVPPPTERKSPIPKGRPPTPAPKPMRQSSSSCTQLDSENDHNLVKVERPTLVNESPVFTFQMPALKPVGKDFRSSATKSARNSTNASIDRKLQRAKMDGPGRESISVKSRIALWKTLEKEKENKPSSVPKSVLSTRRASEPLTNQDSTTKRQLLNAASPELTTHLASQVASSQSPRQKDISKKCNSVDSPNLSNLSSDQMSAETLSPEISSISSGRSTECGMQDSEEELDPSLSKLHLRRISSQKDSNVESSITVEVFDQATGKALQSASRRCSTSDFSADDLNQVCVFNETILSPTSVDDANSCDEQSLPELAGEKADLAMEDNQSENDNMVSSPYSYHEYAQSRKSKTSTPTMLVDSSKPLTLESIPEHDVSEPVVSLLESGRSSAHSQREEKTSSSDSETEFMRKLSTISNTFLHEVIESITSTVAANSVTASSSDTLAVRKTSARIVAELVEKRPELSEYADNIYETIKEFGKKVSQHALVEDNDEEPPELPPRPKFLSDVTLRDDESSPTHDSYVLMQSDSVTSSLSRGSALPAVDDSEAYEPMVFNPQNVLTSKKKTKSPKKMVIKKSPKHKKEADKLSMEDDDELEVPGSPRKRVGLRAGESRQVVKKKKKRSGFFGRSSRDDSSKLSSSHSLPDGVRLNTKIGTCVSPEIAPTPEQAEFGSSEIRRKDGSPLSTAYMNVEFNSSRSCMSLPHDYRKKSSEYLGAIEPSHTSESDSEDRSFSKMVYGADSVTTGSMSPSRVRWADHNARTENSHGTPDSSVYPELFPQHSFPGVIDPQRFTGEPLTPPLVTKLAIRTLPPKGIQFSSSDPNIHETLKVLTASKVRRETIAVATPSPSQSLNRVDSSVESTFSDEETSSLDPSICSFDSLRGAENMWKSPVPRKRLKSDTTIPDIPTISQGALQKERLIQHRRRGGSLPSAGSTESEGVIEVPLVYADAMMDRAPMDQDELGFSVNDVIAVLDMTNDDWWQGMLEDKLGWFPASWVRLRIGQESDDSASMTSAQDDAQDDTQDRVSSGGLDVVVNDPDQEKLSEAREDIGELVQFPNKLNHPERNRSTRRMTIRKKDAGDYPRKLTPTQVRAKCVEEILNTERDYVQHLEDIVQGFLTPCTQHPKLFDAERIETVFSNVEDIYHFQKQFLAELESRVVADKMEDSQIGEVFVKSRHQFALYSEYCNNHPQAVNELNLLQSDSQFALFFESLRLLRNLTDISLDGFLLTPVQKICRYPLQLSELLKYTTEDHPDRPHVLAAQDAMKDVAILINERKRRMENVGMIGYWQETIDSWKGPDIADKSTELLHHGELQKISKGHSQERHFFLFDHQLVYCRKEVVGGKLSYKGRINLDKCLVVDVPDGVVTHNGSAVKNAWRINNVDKGKWYVIFAKSSQAKEEWKKAFDKERLRVQEDQETGFHVTDKMRKAALSLCSIPTNLPRRKSMPRKTNDWVTESLGTAQVHRLRVDSTGVSNVQKSPTERKKLKKRK